MSKNKIISIAISLSLMSQSIVANIASLPTITVTATQPSSSFPGHYQPSYGGERGIPPGVIYSTYSTPTSLGKVSSINAELKDAEDIECKTTSNPIEIAHGAKMQKEVDFTTPGEMPLEFIRYYNSASGPNGPANFSNKRLIQTKWQHNFDYMLARDDKKNYVRLLPDGTKERVDDAKWVLYGSGIYTVLLPDGGAEAYDIAGKLLRKLNAHRVGWTITYDEYDFEQIRKVTHTNGKSIEIQSRDPVFQSNITRVTDPAGNHYHYNYENTSGASNLMGVTYPDGSTRSYDYGGHRWTYLTAILVNGKQLTSYLYDAQNRAIQSGRSDGTQTEKVSYGENYSIVTNAAGAVSKYTYTGTDKTKLSSIERSGVSNCPNASALTTYDNKGLINSRIDWNGVKTEYLRDSSGRVTQEIRGIRNGDYSTALTIKYAWSYDTELPSKVEYFSGVGSTSKAWKTESYTYDDKNNRLRSFTVCDENNCRKQEYNYSLHNNGTPKTITISSNRQVFTYNYDSLGNLTQLKNPLGQTTTYSNYDALGNPGTIIQPNGQTIRYSYDSRSRVINETKEIAPTIFISTSYKYGPFGITEVSSSNGLKEITSYNDNGTIASISHRNNDQVVSQQIYSYSNLGVLQKVEYREGSSIRYSWMNEHNQLGWVTADRGNNGQNIRQEYDAKGNVIKQIDSLNHIKTYSYDPLGRPLQETHSNGSNIMYGWDVFGNLTSVSDASGNKTTYTYNGFGQVLTENSPSRGLSSYTYDNVGNLVTVTHADNKVTRYSYDALNRRTKAVGINQTLVWNYDNCTNGIGRLCAVSDGTSGTGYGYTKDGKISVQITKIEGVSYPTHLSYDNSGRLIGESQGNNDDYKTIYEYDGLNRVNAVKFKIGSNIQTIIRNISYEPYGGVKNWTYGNGLVRQSSYDTDYRLTGITTSGIQNLTHNYNANNWITLISNSVETSKTSSFEYDALGQLIRAASPQYTESWGVNINSNRTSRTGNTNAISAYNIGAGNRLLNITGAEAKNFYYDAVGNQIQKSGYGGTQDYTYDAFNRLKSVKQGGVTTTYDYGAFNLRSRKVSSNGNINYVYAPDGRLLAESPISAIQNGGLGTIYIWLGGQPVGLIRNNQVYYIHNDHLQRPEVITDTNKAVVWKTNTSSYDSAVIQSSIGPFNLGFPGQYYDSESGLWYNWNRYYDPTTGRYTQSDPIGLAGGLNTYAYVENNPVNFIDPYGLWALSVEAYYGYGAGASISYKDGTLEILGRVGVGAGIGIGLDPRGGPSRHSEKCGYGPIARTSLKADVGVGLGPIGASTGITAATGNGFKQKTGGGYVDVNKPSFNIDPTVSGNTPWKFGVAIGGSYGADFGGFYNRK